MNINNNLKLKRQKEGFKQAEIANETRVHVITYQRYESGERVPDVYTAQKFAKKLNTTVEDLFPLPSEKTSLLQNTQENSITES